MTTTFVPWDQETIDTIDESLSDKQKKHLNSLVGKVMGAAKAKKLNPNPQQVRNMLIQKIFAPLFKEELDAQPS